MYIHNLYITLYIYTHAYIHNHSYIYIYTYGPHQNTCLSPEPRHTEAEIQRQQLRRRVDAAVAETKMEHDGTIGYVIWLLLIHLLFFIHIYCVQPLVEMTRILWG